MKLLAVGNSFNDNLYVYNYRKNKPVEANMHVDYAKNITFGEQKFPDILLNSSIAREKQLKKMAEKYIRALESVACKYEKMGISFDKSYSWQNAVKSPESVLSKVKRAKTFHLRDRIRATLYCKNMYDLSITIDKILPEMDRLGYKLATDDMTVSELNKHGYLTNEDNPRKRIKVPDLDIRLANVTNQLENMPVEYKYAISKPQKSGYEDIQMRFVRKDDKSLNSVYHELIILFGPNYAREKHYDSEKIYSYVRQFKELNIMQYGAESEDARIKRVKRYIELIEKKLSSEITSPAYENAKNMDVYNIQSTMKIKILKEEREAIKNYFDSLKEDLISYYKKIIELQEKMKKFEIKNNLIEARKEDMEKIATIKSALLDSIDFYNKGKNMQPC